MTIGDAVKLLRTRAGETQQEMADALGITRPNLSQIEGGVHFPSVKLLAQFRLCYFYDPYILAALTNPAVNVTAHLMLLEAVANG